MWHTILSAHIIFQAENKKDRAQYSYIAEENVIMFWA